MTSPISRMGTSVGAAGGESIRRRRIAGAVRDCSTRLYRTRAHAPVLIFRSVCSELLAFCEPVSLANQFGQ